jgi:F-type H+-transporting ATPase subunit epsilon
MTVFDGEVESVTVPGTKGQFTVLPKHASLITTLNKGYVVYKTADGDHKYLIEGGFAEVKDNIVSVCVEKLFHPSEDEE